MLFLVFFWGGGGVLEYEGPYKKNGNIEKICAFWYKCLLPCNRFIDKWANSCERKLSFFGLISQQCTTYYVLWQARPHDHRSVAKRLTLWRHPSRHKKLKFLEILIF